jgi:hypothetical protein
MLIRMTVIHFRIGEAEQLRCSSGGLRLLLRFVQSHSAHLGS